MCFTIGLSTAVELRKDGSWMATSDSSFGGRTPDKAIDGLFLDTDINQIFQSDVIVQDHWFKVDLNKVHDILAVWVNFYAPEQETTTDLTIRISETDTPPETNWPVCVVQNGPKAGKIYKFICNSRLPGQFVDIRRDAPNHLLELKLSEVSIVVSSFIYRGGKVCFDLNVACESIAANRVLCSNFRLHASAHGLLRNLFGRIQN